MTLISQLGQPCIYILGGYMGSEGGEQLQAADFAYRLRVGINYKDAQVKLHHGTWAPKPFYVPVTKCKT